jgi:regulator of RNase E activity RraA
MSIARYFSVDIVCGDRDGLACVPADKAHEVAEGVKSLAQKEVAALAAIASKTLDRSWIDQTLIARGYLPPSQ